MTCSPLYLGIDLGTSGLRLCAIDATDSPVAEVRRPAPHPERWLTEPTGWWSLLVAAMADLAKVIDPKRIAAISADGTSATLLLVDPSGRPCTPTLAYHDTRATAEAGRIAKIAAAEAPVHGPASGLAKLLWLQCALGADGSHSAAHLCSQADWLLGRLSGDYGGSDPNNMLKVGYDPQSARWPDWLDTLGVRRELLPKVSPAGSTIGPITPEAATRLGLAENTLICRGTTDSTAAVIAAGLDRPGDALTSLGSTLVIKLLSERPIQAARYGVYSQPFGDFWLVGGASNSGGAVLRRFFDDAELTALSARIKPQRDSGLDYYPLPAPGERFPHADPRLAPRLTPRPADDALFLHGLFEGIAAIEAAGYAKLTQLGAPSVRRVASVGGGAHNPVWTRLRERRLGVPLFIPAHHEAAFGAARLAHAAVHATLGG